MGISEYLFGYRCVRAQEGERRALANLLLLHDISSVEQADGSFRLSLFAYRRLCSVDCGRVVYSASSARGLPGVLLRVLPMWGLHLGVLVSLLMLLFLRAHVLAVEVEGNETVSDIAILRELEEAGLYGGARWRDIDLSIVENRMLASSESVGWLSINRRALVAYVSVKEKVRVPEGEQVASPQNLVSRADAVVEEVVLHRGTALVEVGESVAKGALLISGVTEDGTIVSAQGTVLGRVRMEVETACPRICEVAVARERDLVGLSFTFFGKTINILKTSSNLPSDCVIIENNSKVTLFFGRTLPISVSTTYVLTEHTLSYRMSDDELLSAARAMHAESLSHYLSEGDLLSITTHVSLTEEGYRMVSTVCALVDLCTPVPIAAEE